MIDRSADATELPAVEVVVEEEEAAAAVEVDVEDPELEVAVTVAVLVIVAAVVVAVVVTLLERLPVVGGVVEVKSNLLLLQVDMDESVAGGGLDGRGGGSSVMSFNCSKLLWLLL